MKTRFVAIALVAISSTAAVGYMLLPSSGAAVSRAAVRQPAVSTAVALPVASAVQQVAATSPAKPIVGAASARPPVPLAVPARPPASQTGQRVASGTLPVIGGAPTGATALLEAPAGSAEEAAKAAVLTDGYKGVRGLVKGNDGVWRGRALRGSVEIAISVDPAGNVSAQ